MPTARRLFLLGFISLFLLPACASPKPAAPPFETIHRQYVQSLRWGNHNGVARFLPPDSKETFLSTWFGENGLHIVDVTPEFIDYRNIETPVSTQVLVEYYRLPSVTVRKVRLKQEWTYLPSTETSPGGWQLTTPPPTLP